MWGPGRSGWQGPLDACAEMCRSCFVFESLEAVQVVFSMRNPCSGEGTRLDMARLKWFVGSLSAYDNTWLCTDRKDHLGNVVEEQGGTLVEPTLQEGRTIWITPGAGRIPSTPQQREDVVDDQAGHS